MKRAPRAVMLLVSIACATLSAHGGVDRFTNVSPEGAVISALVLDPFEPSTIYAATRAGVFKSVDGSESWALASETTSGSDFTAIAIDPLHPSTIYAGTQMGEITNRKTVGSRGRSSRC